MKPKFRHIGSLASLLTVFTFSTAANAQSTLYWDSTAGGVINDGTGAWLGAGQWNNNGTPSVTWASGDNAIFGNSGAGGAVTLGAGGTTANSLTFNYFTGTYALGTAGNTLTLGGGGITKIAGSGTVNMILSPIILGANQTWTNNGANLNVKSVNIDTNGKTLTIGGTGTVDMGDSPASVAKITGTGGIIKNGSGTLILSGGGTAPLHDFTGGLTVNGGAVRFQSSAFFATTNVTLTNGYLGGRTNSGRTWAGLGTGVNQISITGGVSGFSGEGASSSNFVINTAATSLVWGSTHFNPTVLLLGGDQGMNVDAKGSLSNTIDLSGSTRTITSLHTNGNGAATTGFTLSGAITNTAGTAAGLTKTGPGAIILTAANTYNGATSINGGSLILSGSGTIGSTTALNLSGGGTLRLVNTAQVNRFADVAVTSNGGSISYENTATNLINYTESLGALSLAKGQTNIVLSTDHTAVTGSQKLTFGTAGTDNLTQAGTSTITFSALVTGPDATKNTIAVFGATASGAGNIIGPWATVGTAANVQGTSYAAYDSSGNVIAATLTAASSSDTLLASTTGNYLINTGSAYALTDNRTVNAVQFNGTASTLDLATFKLETKGLFLSGGSTNTKTVSAGVGGALTTPTGGGNLYITTGQVMTALSEHKISAPITNNSGNVNLVKSGAGMLVLDGVNTFTGDIAINAGTLRIGSNGTANNAKLGGLGVTTLATSSSAAVGHFTSPPMPIRSSAAT